VNNMDGQTGHTSITFLHVTAATAKCVHYDLNAYKNEPPFGWLPHMVSCKAYGLRISNFTS